MCVCVCVCVCVRVCVCVCVCVFYPISLTWSLCSLTEVTALFSSTLSLSLSLVLFELHSSYILSTSLISRTLVTRTVMSSMRNWILQLWLPLPAHEALCTLAGTLSSTQPSSLAHTNACHCRPFPLWLWPQGTQTDAPYVSFLCSSLTLSHWALTSLCVSCCVLLSSVVCFCLYLCIYLLSKAEL